MITTKPKSQTDPKPDVLPRWPRAEALLAVVDCRANTVIAEWRPHQGWLPIMSELIKVVPSASDVEFMTAVN